MQSQGSWMTLGVPDGFMLSVPRPLWPPQSPKVWQTSGVSYCPLETHDAQ